MLVQVPGYSYEESKVVLLAPGQSAVRDFFPIFDVTKVASVSELTPVTVRIQVKDAVTDSLWVRETLPLQLLALNSAFLTSVDPYTDEVIDQTCYLGVFVTPNDPEFDAFISEAAQFLPSYHKFDGYQSRDVFPQVRALYDALTAGGTRYVDSTLDFNPAAETRRTQRVRLPRQVLTAHTANRLDGTLLFASLLMHIGIEPAIVILPGHALVAWEPDKGSNEWRHLETTSIGYKSFEDACEKGERIARIRLEKLAATGNDSWYRRWPLRDLVAQGIYPIPLTDGDGLGRIARALEAMAER